MRLNKINDNWDLIIIGGGITGAGILREASRMGINVLLIEQKDFAWGTSSRSSKLVHGGLRYLKDGRIFLTRDSVVERERLLREAPGLVEPIGFLMPIFKNSGPGRWLIEIGLTLYDLLAFKRQHNYFDKESFKKIVPQINDKDLTGGFRFIDAQVDDARLVLRVINEAVENGATALNYIEAVSIIRNESGDLVGVKVFDPETNDSKILSTKAAINASGAWAEKLHPSPDSKLHIRPLRGSHLIFPADVLPIKEAVSFQHPEDNRPVFGFPWEGAVLFGTTDYDHNKDLNLEPRISKEEVTYLMNAVNSLFPSLNISLSDCIATIAGVRPVLSQGKLDPSKESREHVVWIDKGLVTITGGKLTTFRRLAWDALKAVKPFLSITKLSGKGDPVFSKITVSKPSDKKISDESWKRICGRYGNKALDIVNQADNKDLENIPGTYTLWAELPHVANEYIINLSDLLLRRVRIGLLTPDGGMQFMDRIKDLCSPYLQWDEQTWKKQIENYYDLWISSYKL